MKWFTVTLYTINVLFQFSLCTIKPCKRDNTINLIFRSIIAKNELTGFTIFNFYKKDNPKISSRVNEIISHLTKTTTIASVDSRVSSILHRFRRNVKRFKSNAFLLQENLIARDKVCMIMIINSQLLAIKDINNMILNSYHLFSSVQGVFKMLLISVGSTKYKKYKQFLRNMARNHAYSIDVLEIVANRARRLSDTCRYTVVQFNSFSNKLITRRYHKKVTFFPCLVKNLHRKKFTISRLGPKREKFTWSKGGNKMSFVGIYLLVAYPLEVALSKSNASLDYMTEIKSADFDVLSCGLFPRIDMSYMYPPKMKRIYFVLPSMYDEIHSKSYTLFISSLLTITLMVTSFLAWSKLFYDNNNQTWYPIIIFSMIIGLANPRNPVKLAETVLFMCLISVGFFCGSDLVFDVSSVTVIQHVERRLETLDNVIENNITLVFMGSPVKRWPSDIVSNIKWIEMKKFDDNKCSFEHLLRFGNVSVTPCYVEMLGVSFPERIMSGTNVLARKSNINDFYYGKMLIVHLNSPWLHHLSHNILRFHSCGLEKIPKVTAYQLKFYNNAIGKHIDRVISDTNKLSLSSELDLAHILLIVTFGWVFSFIVLALEILKHKNY